VKRVIAVAGLLAVSGQALAQDSVAQTPGGNDALSAYDAQLVRYAVDLTPVTSSWGSTFVVGPVIKSSRSLEPGITTQKLVGAVVSPDVENNAAPGIHAYSIWNTRGEGMHPTENSPPGTINIGSFDRRFGLACADLGVGPTNILTALIGWRDNDPDRLYVERRVALSSRASAPGQDTSTLSIGGVDADGDVCIRADDFLIPVATPNKIVDDNIVRVDSKNRNAAPNALRNMLGLNTSDDPAATFYFVNQSGVSVSPPAGMPTSKSSAGDGAPIILDFQGAHRIGGGPQLFDHLDPGVDAHRGAPSYSTLSFNSGDAGSFAFLAISDAATSLRVDALAAVTIDGAGAPMDTISAVLPPSLTDGAFMATTPEFTGHLSQASFRGGNGPVAIGSDMNGDVLLAASASSADAGEFIAVASFPAPTGTTAALWSVAAYVGKPVLDGPGGQQIGAIVDGAMIGSPVSLSSPAVDLLGNVYFVAAYKPNLGAARTAVIKAVNTGAGYELEILLEEFQIVVGANSTRPYEIHSITLGDADSIASGSIWSGSVLQERRLGAGGSALLADAFGGLVVSAVIEYDNLAQLEFYDAVLFIGPKGLEGLVGDINGDGVVDTADLGELIASFGAASQSADINGDGVVDTADLGLLIAHFGEIG